jgi:Methylamine utilisation protein MauE
VRWIAPVLLAAVFAFAAGAKFADQGATAEGFRALRLRHANRLAIQIPAVELATAVLLIVAPVGGAIVALLLLLGFSILLVRRLRAGSEAPCKCFGSTRTRPIAWTDLVRNGVLAALAFVILVFPPGA